MVAGGRRGEATLSTHRVDRGAATMEASPMAVTLGWWDIAKLALGAGILTAVLNHGVTWLRDRLSIKQTARYLALRVAVTLESFATECSQLVVESELSLHSDGHAGQSRTVLPQLGEYPGDANWAALAPGLASRALSFRNEIQMAQSAISFQSDVGEDSVSDECSHQASICGSDP